MKKLDDGETLLDYTEVRPKPKAHDEKHTYEGSGGDTTESECASDKETVRKDRKEQLAVRRRAADQNPA